MKKVPILTDNSFNPRSFIWDDIFNAFKVKVSGNPGNAIQALEDGLYIEGVAQEPPPGPVDGPIMMSMMSEPSVDNKIARVNFVNNEAKYANLLFKIVVSEAYRVRITCTTNMQITPIRNIGWVSPVWVGPNQDVIEIDIDKGLRIAYVENERLVVIDLAVFQQLDNFNKVNGFLDIVINVPLQAFEPVIIDAPEQT